jgi:cysteine desulfurase
MIYLDYNATTPIDPQVREAMLPYLGREYGNPSSSHALGRAAHRAIDHARGQVAALLACRPAEIVFTGGGSESNNLALKGAALARRFANPRFADRGHLVISAIEHPAVIQPARFLERLGFAVTVVGVDRQGLVNPDEVAAALRDDTVLVSIMHANNEIGTIQPIQKIANRCRVRDVLVHTDAAQSVGKIPTRVEELDVDLLTIAGHKLYAPKGIGALYVRKGVVLEPVLHGAGHESGLRAGTENVPYIVGLGKAAELAAANLAQNAKRLTQLRDQLLARLRDAMGPAAVVNGEQAPRLPNTLSVNFPGVSGGELLRRCADLCASTGAACHADSTTLSATLAALGIAPEAGRGCIRLSLGWYTTEGEIAAASEQLITAWRTLAQP